MVMAIAQLCVRQVNGLRELVVVDLEQSVDALKSELLASRRCAQQGQSAVDSPSIK